jgi:hypothetical protein
MWALPPLPFRIDPVKLDRFGGWIAVRCPADFIPIFWGPAGRRWLVESKRLGPVICALERRPTLACIIQPFASAPGGECVPRS